MAVHPSAIDSAGTPGIAGELREVERRAALRAQGAGRTFAFVWQVVSGAALIGLVGLHMVAQHFILPTGLRTYAEVVQYVTTPVIMVLEVAFLGTVTWHALMGVRSILFDAGFAPATERRITWLLTAVGIATVAYGLWLLAVIAGIV
jgi:succinate dehydrogenase hydrophobic anchor subunit